MTAIVPTRLTGSALATERIFTPFDFLLPRQPAGSTMPSRELLAKATASQFEFCGNRISGSVGQKGRHVMSLPAKSTKEQLDQKLMDLKIQTAQLQHLPSDWRAGIFKQLDMLLDEANWEPIDRLPERSSYHSAIRLLIFLGDIRRPGLGLSHEGNIVLSWTAERDHLTIECRPNDVVRWMVSHTLPEQTRERAAGVSVATRVPAVLAAYDPDRWLKAQ